MGPETSDTTFTFSFAKALEAEKDITLQLEALQARIDALIQKARLQEHPVIAIMLSITHDPEELGVVANALQRVAEIIPRIDELKAQKTMLDLARTDPNKLQFLFGDFTTDVDKLLSELPKF